jgi:PKD repeat protein
MKTSSRIPVARAILGCCALPLLAVVLASCGGGESTAPGDDGTFKNIIVFIDAHPEEGDAPLLVEFNVSKDANSGLPPVRYRWTIKEAGADKVVLEQTERTFVHTFERAGNFDVHLDATDARGESDSDEINILVY